MEVTSQIDSDDLRVQLRRIVPVSASKAPRECQRKVLGVRPQPSHVFIPCNPFKHVVTSLHMPVTTVTSRELNQDIGYAKKAANSGPVFITHRGKPAHVLLSIEDYRKLAGQRRSLVEALSMPGLADIDFEPPRISIETSLPDLG